MVRVVLPEKLDALSEDDPAALASRHDLNRINRVMGNFSWIHRCLRAIPQARHDPVAEWAAGDGRLGRILFSHATVAHLTGIDRWSRPKDWPKEWNWHQGSLETWPDYSTHPIVIGNLILHQFCDKTLARFGHSLAQHASVLIFNEPLRSRISHLLARLLLVAGAHPVTQHDARVSIRAGFSGDELPTLLGLKPTEWSWTVQTTWLGAYRLIAKRREEHP